MKLGQRQWQAWLQLKEAPSLSRVTGAGPPIPGSGFPFKVYWYTNPVSYLKQQIL